MGQFLKERFYCRQVSDINADLGRLDRARLETGSNGGHVGVARTVGHAEPDRDDGERHQTQLWPGEPQELNHDQHQECTNAPRDPIDRDVNEGLGSKPDLTRERQKEDLAGCPVDGVPDRSIDDAGYCRGPQGTRDHDQHGGHPQADREREDGNTNAKQPIDPLDENDLKDERDG